MMRSDNWFFRGISKNAFALGAVSLFADVSTEMVFPLLPAFITQVLGKSILFLGLIEGAAESAVSLLKLVSGLISDRLGVRKNLVISGYALSAASKPAIAVAMTGWHVFGARLADRVGKGVRGAPRDALLSASTEPKYMGKAFGFNRSMDHLGAVIGPLIAFLILMVQPGNYRLVFWIAVTPAVFTLLTLGLFVTEKKPALAANPGAGTKAGPRFEGRFKVFLAAVLIFALGNSSDAFLLLRAQELGVSLQMLPIIWLLLSLVKMSTNMPLGARSDISGRKRSILAGWVLYAFVYAGLALAGNALHAWVLFAIYGVYFGLTEGVERALVADLVPDEGRGGAYGYYNLAIGIAAFPSSLLMGLLWKLYGPAFAFGSGSALALIAAAIILPLRLDAKLERDKIRLSEG